MQSPPQAIKSKVEDLVEPKPQNQDHSMQTCLGDLNKERHTQDSSNVTKIIRKGRLIRKSYVYIGDETRFKLLDAVKNKKEKIKHAAQKLGINYSSAKSICQVFTKERRLNRIICKNKGSNFQIGHHLIGQNEVVDKTRVQSTQIVLYEKSSILKRGNIITSQKDYIEILQRQPNNLQSLDIKQPSFYLLQPVNFNQLQTLDGQPSISPLINLGKERVQTHASSQNNSLIMNALNQANTRFPALHNINITPQSNQNFQMVSYQNSYPNLCQINFMPLTTPKVPIVQCQLANHSILSSQNKIYMVNEKLLTSSIVHTQPIITLDPQIPIGSQQQLPYLYQHQVLQNNSQQLFEPAKHIIPLVNHTSNQGNLVFQGLGYFKAS